MFLAPLIASYAVDSQAATAAAARGLPTACALSAVEVGMIKAAMAGSNCSAASYEISRWPRC